LLENETIVSCIRFTIAEMTRHSEPTALIQKPCKEILVSLGVIHCKLVMDELMTLLQPHAVGHFMIVETLGQLARANLEESVSYIKPILGTAIPMLTLIKQDFQKQSYANGIQQFCDAIIEYKSQVERGSQASNLSNEPDLETTSLNDVEIVEKINKNQLDISAEIGITYDVMMQQWINTRDAKLCSEFLNVLSYMYPLLPTNKILDNTSKIIHTLLTMYKRSVDRASISIFLSSVIGTTQKLDAKLLDSQADAIIVTLFDLICTNPDFEKPVAVRSHNEVLRCYDLLAKNYGEKVMEIISQRFKSNDDREKVKALMLLTHLTNSKDEIVKLRLKEFLTILRQMVLSERQFKMKAIILRAVVAFAHKGFIEQTIFVKFLVHHCCPLVKVQIDQGSADEAAEFVQSCNKTLIILSRTGSSMDNLLKAELLQMFMLQEYTEAVTTMAKCLATLFQKVRRFDEILRRFPEVSTVFPSTEPRHARQPRRSRRRCQRRIIEDPQRTPETPFTRIHLRSLSRSPRQLRQQGANQRDPQLPVALLPESFGKTLAASVG
jgi:maestro heat-like repeat-containing protein family member 1